MKTFLVPTHFDHNAAALFTFATAFLLCFPSSLADDDYPPPSEKSTTRRKIIIGLCTGFGALLLTFLVLGICYRWRQLRRRRSHALPYVQRSIPSNPPNPPNPSSVEEVENGGTYLGVHLFSYKELEEATNHFDSNKELGDGGFGTVYYGLLKDGRAVAVKRLYESNFKRVEQFMNEVEILARLRHRNLVSLYGCTSRSSHELLLVYEYVPNGTVADHLHGKLAKSGKLPWCTRMKIAIETASALVYLHASEIIHRDVKTKLAAAASAKEIPRDAKRHAELYETGIVHEKIMAAKAAQLQESEEMGVMAAVTYGPTYDELGFGQCKDGWAQPIRADTVNRFKCNNINMHHFLSHSQLGSATGLGSSSWGWVSDDGREFAIIAQGDGAAFAEITTAGQLRYLGRLPQTTGVAPSRWRELRTNNNFLVVGSEEPGHGVQFFDLKKLLDIDYKKGPVTFNPDKDLTAFWNDLPLGRVHNVLTNPETNFAYVVGAQPRNDTCRSGIHMLDMSDPTKITSPGCASKDGYVHDAQCLIYRGPHTKYLGREICYGYNEDALTIYDLTDKAFPEIISITSYEGASYTHQGWVLNTDYQEYLIMDDELDEQEKRGPAANGKPTTFIWDIRNLERPKQTGYYQGPRTVIDHNQYVYGKYAYQSNYGAGISVLDVSSIPSDPTGRGVKEVASFDVYPNDDDFEGGGTVAFVGTWSSYAGYPSGFILINTIERGAWVVKVQKALP